MVFGVGNRESLCRENKSRNCRSVLFEVKRRENSSPCGCGWRNTVIVLVSSFLKETRMSWAK